MKPTLTDCPPPEYVRVTTKPDGTYVGTIVVQGEDRWKRENACPYKLAAMLRACRPGIDYVATADGEIHDTGCLTLGECIELAA